MSFKPAERSIVRQLEAMVVAHPDDDEVLDRLGLHLVAAGDPRGDLIALDAAWEARASERESIAAERADLFRDCGPTLAPAAIIEMAARAAAQPGLRVSLGERSWVRWRRGFIRGLRLDVSDCPGGKLQAVVDEILGHPAAMLLDDLRMTPPPVHGVSHPELIASLAGRPPPLRRLELGAPGGIGSFELGDLRRLWPALPRLRELVLQGDAPVLGVLELAELRSLSLRGARLDDPAIIDLARSPLPSLERFELDLGPAHRISVRAMAELIDALSGAPLAALAIGGAGPLAPALLHRLLGSGVLARLRSLALRRAELGDRDVIALVDHAGAFAHLETLDLSGCTLSNGARRALAPLASQLGALVL